MNTRKLPEARYDEIIDAGIELTQAGRFHSFTRDDVALAVGVAPSLITHYFGDMDLLKRAIISAGCKRRICQVILIGLACSHPDAIALPEDAKLAALSGDK